MRLVSHKFKTNRALMHWGSKRVGGGMGNFALKRSLECTDVRNSLIFKVLIFQNQCISPQKNALTPPKTVHWPFCPALLCTDRQCIVFGFSALVPPISANFYPSVHFPFPRMHCKCTPLFSFISFIINHLKKREKGKVH